MSDEANEREVAIYERDDAREALAAMTKERDALRSARQKGCDCTDDEACRFARERDEARAQAAKLEAVLVSRHGGEPVALLEELDEARAEVKRLRADMAAFSAEFGLPPGIRPVEGEITRMRDGWRAALAEVATMSKACAEEMLKRELAEKCQAVLAADAERLHAAMRSAAERQRTACAAFVRDNYYECAASEAVGTDPMWCVAQTPLVTEGE